MPSTFDKKGKTMWPRHQTNCVVFPKSVFKNPNKSSLSLCACKQPCGRTSYKKVDTEKILEHDCEHMRRLAWCVNKKLVPAHEHVHKAPGDDSRFVYNVPPWNQDGSPNPCGIFYSETDVYLKQIEQDSRANESASMYGSKSWSCHRCGKTVKMPPRPYVGGPEPWDWWFCFECKAKAVKPSAKTLKEKAEAKTCLRIVKTSKGIGLR